MEGGEVTASYGKAVEHTLNSAVINAPLTQDHIVKVEGSEVTVGRGDTVEHEFDWVSLQEPLLLLQPSSPCHSLVRCSLHLLPASSDCAPFVSLLSSACCICTHIALLATDCAPPLHVAR